ncbi:UDP-N-acetylmuramate--L-alanine ligase [Paenibacillus mesotrionivorans]|uniref:UDP-N-acetylmuramate--L-alanine ligase n=1 Tax=Paenibacillus mesotrionivorans TaxID=3160968 RepID=A0ACC7NUP8_9BACL
MNTSEHVHFIGIGGYGMSAIAKVMLEMGFHVSGSDLAQQELTEKLAKKGADVFIGHEAEHVQGADLVVYSTALSKDNVEIKRAEELNIPVIHRSEMLARLLNTKKGVAVAGAHGKTTTSSMISLVLEQCGTDPTYIIGGEILNLGSNAKAGKGDYVVAEADESDGTFLQYHPYLGVVTNIEADHLEHYDGDFEKLKSAYARFLSQVKSDGKAVVCADDPYIEAMLPELGGKAVTYGLGKGADYSAHDLILGDRRVQFTVHHKDEILGTMRLSVPGKHNVYNALATLIVCLDAGLSFSQIAEAIVDFRGAKRRFQVMGESGGILVIDDYAHHPTEIEATISAARATGKRIVAVFQPQRYTRTFFLLDQFSRAFPEADEVVLTDIYSPAGEQQIEGISSARLAGLIRENSNPQVRHLPTKDDVFDYLQSTVTSGDLVITMGAGDIWKVADRLAKDLRARYGEE